MSWFGQVPTDANWQGAPQFPGSEVLYTTPDPATTTTNPSIGIVDGNEIPLPTAYNTLAVGTLTSATGDITTLNSTTINNSGTIITNLVNAAIGDITTINSTNINNSGNINTNTINGNAVPTSAEFWSNYQAVNNVVARDAPRNAYVPNLWYAGFASYVSYGNPYQNYETSIAGAGLNPSNRLDPFVPTANYTGMFGSNIGATYNGIQYLLKAIGNPPAPDTVPPPDPTYWRLAEYQPTYVYLGGNLTFHAATNAWYESIGGSTGQAPPNPSYWTVYQRWVVLTSPNLLGLKYWNISNFNDIASTTSHVYQANATVAEITTGNITNVTSQNINNTDTLTTRVGNVKTNLNIGTSGLLGDGGTLKIGYETLNPILTPSVTIGNSTINKCSVEIFGEKNITANNALLVHGGFTVVAGPWGTTVPDSLQNHGISLNAAQLLGVSTVTYNQDLLGIRMVASAPTGQNIQLTSRFGILEFTSQNFGTYINAKTGLFVTESSGQYGGGRIFTDHICPGYTSGSVLLINGRNDYTSGVTGVQIDNGTTWNTTTLNATTLNTTTLNTTNVVATGNVGCVNLNASGNVVATGNVSCVDLTSTGNALINNLVVADVTAGKLTTSTFVNIPESNTSPADYDGGTTYDQYALVIYAPTNTLYFSLVNANQGNDPSTSPTFWLLANWDVATTYSIGNPTFETATQSLWTSLQNSNTGNFPTTPLNWDFFETYGNGAIVVYNALHYQSLQAANTGNLPDDVGSVWWVNIPIYWTPNTTSYNIGSTNTGIVFTPLVSGFTGITSLVKRFGDPDEELNVIVKTPQNVELSAQSVVVSPMYKDFDMGTKNITNLGNITAAGNLSIAVPTGNTLVLVSGDLDLEADGIVTLNSSTERTQISAEKNITITSATSYIDLTAGAGQNIQIQSPLDMSNNNIFDASTITGQTALTLATLSNGNLNLSPDGTGLIEANKGIDMNNNNISGGNTITGTTALTLATLSNGNLNLSPNGTGLIEANKGVDMNNNTIVGASTITGTTTLTLASTGNSNINISPAGTGQVVINKQVNFSSQTLYNMTLTNCFGVYGAPSGALVLVSQQAVNPTVQIRGSLQMWLNSTTQAPGNSITGLTTLTGQTTLGLATLSNGDLSLSPNGTGTIIANKTLNMNSNPITNLTTLNGRNLFAYGNFYNDANQTLTATNTATRVKMNTSLNNNLITLDTTTNIGRLTFTNAGVYHVVWNAYLFHGSGGTTKTRIWIRLNGTDVGGSGKTEDNDSQRNETNLTSSSMVSVTASQYIEFYWAADGTNVPLTAVAASAPYPATPSFSCTISIVG